MTLSALRFSLLLAASSALVACGRADAASGPLPAAALDVPANGAVQTAVLAGGCFWGIEGVFERVKGVKSVVSGYAGGSARDANYAAVSSERTRHVEAVRIVYDPSVVSYGTLLRIYFAVAHDPTQLNRQGPDVGPSYRSAIFPQDAFQARSARAYIGQLGRSGSFKRPIVTTIETGRFFTAEANHQDFMRRNPRHPYILAHDLAKVRALKQRFPEFYRG